jgi:hypothetical protein
MIGTMTTTRIGLALALAVAMGLGLGRDAAAQPAAGADETARCEVLEIRASNEDGDVDPALRPLAKKLKKPPFSAWKRFALLKAHTQQVARMKSVDVALVPGGKLSLLYREKVAGKKKVRLRLSFTLDDKGGTRLFNGTVNLDAGDYSLIGGEPLDGDATYILAVTCKA